MHSPRQGGPVNAPLFTNVSGMVSLDAGEVMDLSLVQTHSLSEIQKNLQLVTDSNIWLAEITRTLGWG
jgi:hypothetical protein